MLHVSRPNFKFKLCSYQIVYLYNRNDGKTLTFIFAAMCSKSGDKAKLDTDRIGLRLHGWRTGLRIHVSMAQTLVLRSL